MGLKEARWRIYVLQSQCAHTNATAAMLGRLRAKESGIQLMSSREDMHHLGIVGMTHIWEME